MVQGMVTTCTGDEEGAVGSRAHRCHSLGFQDSMCQDPRRIHWFDAFQFLSSPGVWLSGTDQCCGNGSRGKRGWERAVSKWLFLMGKALGGHL